MNLSTVGYRGYSLRGVFESPVDRGPDCVLLARGSVTWHILSLHDVNFHEVARYRTPPSSGEAEFGLDHRSV